LKRCLCFTSLQPVIHVHVKNLSVGWGHCLKRAVLFDNNPLSFWANPSNFYDVSPDAKPPAVMDFLAKLHDQADIRPILESGFCLKQALDEIQSGLPTVSRPFRLDVQQQKQQQAVTVNSVPAPVPAPAPAPVPVSLSLSLSLSVPMPVPTVVSSVKKLSVGRGDRLKLTTKAAGNKGWECKKNSGLRARLSEWHCIIQQFQSPWRDMQLSWDFISPSARP
jgi:hypothetical protein